jgi:hypothetical protein
LSHALRLEVGSRRRGVGSTASAFSTVVSAGTNAGEGDIVSTEEDFSGHVEASGLEMETWVWDLEVTPDDVVLCGVPLLAVELEFRIFPRPHKELVEGMVMVVKAPLEG